MSYIQSVRAIKGLAPKAGEFNRLAQNLEYLDAKTIPKACLVKKSANQTLNFPVTGNGVSLTWDTEVYDPSNMYSASVFTYPTDATLARWIVQIRATATANLNVKLTPSGGGAFIRFYDSSAQLLAGFGQNSFQIGYNATGDNVRSFQADSGWIPITGGSTVTAASAAFVESPASSSFTVEGSNFYTWLYLEVI